VSPIAVDVLDVSKRFRLYHEKRSSVKERLLHAGNNPYEDLWALRDVSVEIPEGHTVGILGRNGSGKSTLLKCVAGILQPTTGKVVVRGALAAMLELGAGMQPELSGRDNIYLNGSLLGLSRREVDRRFDEIVAFAELENFIDNQVKFYSSGMYVRLGFAVAVNVDPDVLIIDEVLAVGDENFQRKCLGRIKAFQEDGRTILFVTHSPELVRQICDTVIVMNQGRTVTVAPPGEGIRVFREQLLEARGALEIVRQDEPSSANGAEPTAAGELNGDGSRSSAHGGPISITSVGSRYAVADRPYIRPGEPLDLVVQFDTHRELPDVVFGFEISNADGVVLFATDTEILGEHLEALPGPSSLTLHIETVPLLDGQFSVNVTARERQSGLVFDRYEGAGSFDVVNPGRTSGLVAMDTRVSQV
jgi:ABC-2 type transport system ATP-binding protein